MRTAPHQANRSAPSAPDYKRAETSIACRNEPDQGPHDFAAGWRLSAENSPDVERRRRRNSRSATCQSEVFSRAHQLGKLLQDPRPGSLQELSDLPSRPRAARLPGLAEEAAS